MQTHAPRWYRFVVTLKHDRGTVRLRVTSPTAEQARQQACAAEGCPESAIVKCSRKGLIS